MERASRARRTCSSRPGAVFAEQDEEFRANQKVKEEILAEAEALDVAQGRDTATKQLRVLQERWEAAGKVPRDVMRSLEDRMGEVEQRFRAVRGRPLHHAPESPFAVRLREKVAELEVKLAKAEAAGRPTDELRQQLVTQRSGCAGRWHGRRPGRAGPTKAKNDAWVAGRLVAPTRAALPRALSPAGSRRNPIARPHAVAASSGE